MAPAITGLRKSRPHRQPMLKPCTSPTVRYGPSCRYGASRWSCVGAASKAPNSSTSRIATQTAAGRSISWTQASPRARRAPTLKAQIRPSGSRCSARKRSVAWTCSPAKTLTPAITPSSSVSTGQPSTHHKGTQPPTRAAPPATGTASRTAASPASTPRPAANARPAAALRRRPGPFPALRKQAFPRSVPSLWRAYLLAVANPLALLFAAEPARDLPPGLPARAIRQGDSVPAARTGEGVEENPARDSCRATGTR